mmetsp:Transcript_26942/g.78179  ORF Transcript_26942/g.78179 Transcript_26942/m.78179 type:complete len:278 (+) Transcript_26942:357-1190(+)
MQPARRARFIGAREKREHQSARDDRGCLCKGEAVKEHRGGDDILRQPGGHVGAAEAIANDVVRQRPCNSPDAEGKHKEDIVQPSSKVTEDDQPRHAKYHEKHRQIIQNPCRQRGDHEGADGNAEGEAEQQHQHVALGPDAQLMRKAALVQRALFASLATSEDLGNVGLVLARAARDETVEFAKVLDDQAQAWQGREQDGRDDPCDEGNHDQRHRQLPLAILNGERHVHGVRRHQRHRRNVMGLPVRGVDIPPRLVLIGRGSPGKEVPGDARHYALSH